MLKGYVFEVRGNGFYSYLFATSAREAKAEFTKRNNVKAISCEKRSGKTTSEAVKGICINL